MENDKIKKAFSIYNGGLKDYTALVLLLNIITKSKTFNYIIHLPQKIRRIMVPFRYKANFGNLVNNVVQRMIANVIYTSKTD